MKNKYCCCCCIDMHAWHCTNTWPITTKAGQNLAGNLKVVTKANLSISALSLLSATGGNDRWDIKLAVTIKNNGGLKTPECKIRAVAQNAAAASNPLERT